MKSRFKALGEYVSLNTPLVTLVGGAVFSLATVFGAPHLDRESYRMKIVGAERLTSSESKYLVFGIDEKTAEPRAFENTDSTLELKFNSSTLQVKVERAEKNGDTCAIDTYGWRIPLFSKYENIIGLECEMGEK